MNKEFIPYEQALELKELGFEPTPIGGFKQDAVFYYENGNLYYDYKPMYSSTAHEGQILAPLYQQAFRWFRDKKLSDGSVGRHGEADGGYSYRWDIVYEYGVYEERHFKKGYKTYEEAEFECLKNIVEIVKNK